jgi:predicted nucleic acid-binding protein
LRRGLLEQNFWLPQQALIEFVAAVSRPRAAFGGRPLLPLAHALREVESFCVQFPVLYPDHDVLITAVRGCSTYGLSWFDAHLWAFAEVNGIAEILSEDFEHGRHYGGVRVVDPFLEASGISEPLPPLYGPADAG